MRVTKFARTLIGMASLFVTGVRFEGSCLIAEVRPTWRLPRCSQCGRIAPGYDRRKEPTLWVHLHIGAVRILLEYAPRRVACPTCGVHIEKVPWARHDSRFTEPFEEMTTYLAQVANKTEVSRIMGISWRTVGHIIMRVVADKLDPARLDHLRRIGIDEFSYRKRHHYITIVVDHDRHRVVWAMEGKSSDTLDAFFVQLGPERAAKLQVITIDMAAGYIKAIENKAPQAQIVFDRFHVQKLASDAVDDVRRDLARSLQELDDPDAASSVKKSRFVLLKRPWDLGPKEWDKLSAIQVHNAPLYRAYLLKESLADVFDEFSLNQAESAIDRWLSWASRSKLEPFIQVARTIRQYKDRILAYIQNRLTNGLAEGFNNKLRMVARRAFGFHSAQALISMLFLCCGGVVTHPPLPLSWCHF